MGRLDNTDKDAGSVLNVFGTQRGYTGRTPDTATSPPVRRGYDGRISEVDTSARDAMIGDVAMEGSRALGDLAGGIISAGGNRKAREQAETLAYQTRSDQLSQQLFENRLTQEVVRLSEEKEQTRQMNDNFIFQYEVFKNELAKQKLRRETLSNAAKTIGDAMSVDEKFRNLMLGKVGGSIPTKEE